MNLLYWITAGFFIIGFLVFFSMKKEMENKVALLKMQPEAENNDAKEQAVIWWIWGVVIWGVLSLCLVVWSFFDYFG